MGDRNRRRFLGAAAGTLASLQVPRPVAGPAPSSTSDWLDVDLASIPEGQTAQVEWQGKPVFVRHRTAEEVEQAVSVPLEALRDAEADHQRVRRPHWLVVIGLCTHAGCIPKGPLGDYGGWYCFCHGSAFDTAGRVRAGPARTNLAIPPYRFVNDHTIRIGQSTRVPGEDR